MTRSKIIAAGLILLFCFAAGVRAQTTELTYQGRLIDGSLPPTGEYDFELKLFATETGGTALATVQHLDVRVTNGIFSVRLNFPGQFGGAPRWLEIAVRQAGGEGPFTVLSPRQLVTSAPYAIRSLNAATSELSADSNKLGGVSASQFVQSSDSRLTDERDPRPGSTNYIQNSSLQQSTANFNISGNGTVGGTLSAPIVNASAQFNIGFDRMLAKGTASVFGGPLAGISTTTGSGNTFFGYSAGRFNTTASNNSFFGREAGSLSTGGDNTFFGAFTGSSNTTGNRNSFFGRSSGSENTTGNDNSFFGFRAGFSNAGVSNALFGSGSGEANTSGSSNTFFGFNSGSLNTTGNANVFVGGNAGNANVTGNANTVVGWNADVGTPNLTFATAIGAGAVVTESNTLVLGRTSDKVKLSILQITGGSDLAENFEVKDGIGAGMVVAIDPANPGKLVLSRRAYDRRVAGVISGANDLSAGMVLSDLKGAQNSLPLALSGRVWVYADATKVPIRPGDLLTTSAIAGHAMKVTDYRRAQGAIIGKAMTGLRSSKGLVLVLVTLQ